MNKRTTLVVAVAVAVAVAIVGVGGYWAYESYRGDQRMKAWEFLLNEDSCDVCAARKAGIAEKQEEQKAKAAELATQEAQGAQSETNQ